ncbi:YozE family protein [Solibacillus sp. FSL R7-0682]|uniref:YozE family protein n=1 Tax=Solibacillus sp. FSL R7-0682 TaxID=2921690 RepID=UPI0030F9BBCE
MTFKYWLLNCSDWAEYGFLSTDVAEDETFPDSDNYFEIMLYLINQNAGEWSKQMFNDAWNEYLTVQGKELAQ